MALITALNVLQILTQRNMNNNTINESNENFIKKWSWGAFFISTIWAFASRSYLYGILLLFTTFIPVVNLIVAIIFGKKGRKLVWEQKKWEDFEKFKKRQKLLDTIGYSLFLISLAVYIITEIINFQ